MKKSALKIAIASAVLASGSAMALDTADVYVDLLLGDTANLAMSTNNIFLSAPALTATSVSGSATGCAFSSTGAYTTTMTSLNGNFLVGSAGAIPYTSSFVDGPSTIPSCGGIDNFSVDVSVVLDGNQVAGTYSDVLTVVIATL